MVKGKYIRTPKTIEKLRNSQKKRKPRIMNCEMCKEEFETISYNKKCCVDCNGKRIKEIRNNWRKNNPEKNKAQLKILTEIRAGRMLPAKEFLCVFCENYAEEYHHPDYSKPLEVKPLCHDCHMKLHNLSEELI